MNFDVIPYLLSSETSKVQYSIDSRILNLQILEMIVTTNNGSVTDFDEIAATLCKDDPAVRSLQLPPDGVVSYIYPTEALIKIADERMYQDKEAAHRADSTAVRL